MKNQPFISRARFALSGIWAALKAEASFKTQVAMAMLALAATWAVRPPAVWVALVAVMIGLVLAAELINTALEHALDALHPEPARFIRVAKDCAAAAVLMLSFTAVVVFLLMLYDVYFAQR